MINHEDYKVALSFLAILAIIAFIGGFCIAWWAKPPVTLLIEKTKIKGYICDACGYRVRDESTVDKTTVYKNGEKQ